MVIMMVVVVIIIKALFYGIIKNEEKSVKFFGRVDYNETAGLDIFNDVRLGELGGNRINVMKQNQIERVERPSNRRSEKENKR